MKTALLEILGKPNNTNRLLRPFPSNFLLQRNTTQTGLSSNLRKSEGDLSARSETYRSFQRIISRHPHRGSAFPATLAFQIRELERETSRALTLDAIVTVIDAENFSGYEDTSVTARMQAQYTDVLLIVSHPLPSPKPPF